MLLPCLHASSVAYATQSMIGTGAAAMYQYGRSSVANDTAWRIPYAVNDVPQPITKKLSQLAVSMRLQPNEK